MYACAYDIPVPGYGPNAVCNTMRFWSAKSTNEFDLNYCKRNLKFHILLSYYENDYKQICQNTISIICLHLFCEFGAPKTENDVKHLRWGFLQKYLTAYPEPC